MLWGSGGLDERMSVDTAWAVSDKDPMAGKPPALAQKACGAPAAGAAIAATAPAEGVRRAKRSRTPVCREAGGGACSFCQA